VGFGSGLVSVSFLATALGPTDAVTTVLAVSLVLNLLVVVFERSGLDARSAAILFLPSVALQLAAAPAIRASDPSTLTIATGVAVVIAAVMIGAGGKLRFLDGRVGLVIAGSLSGTMNLVAGLGGPAAVLYAANEGWEPHRWRPTINLYFAMNNTVSLVLLRNSPPGDPWIYTLALVGAAGGGLAATRLPSGAVRRAALILAAVGGMLAIKTGLSI
jgi:uncharacterized protein